jgi:predicted O-methyltransferase YrrM
MDRDIVHTDIEAYLAGLVGTANEVSAEMEEVARQRDFPIVGPLVGRLLSVLARSVGAEQVCELGSGFGYSTLYFADVVGPAGRVVHTDTSQARSDEARAFLERAGLVERIEFCVGDALEVLESCSGPFDLVFCDVDKEAYPRVPDLAVPRLRTGGLLVFDNTLWHGRVPDAEADETTAAVQELNRVLHRRADLLTSIVPLRDGVSVSVKL